MIVCHCMGISEDQVRRAVRDGAVSPRQLVRACGVGTGCGGCRPAIEKILVEETRGPRQVRPRELPLAEAAAR